MVYIKAAKRLHIVQRLPWIFLAAVTQWCKIALLLTPHGRKKNRRFYFATWYFIGLLHYSKHFLVHDNKKLNTARWKIKLLGSYGQKHHHSLGQFDSALYFAMKILNITFITSFRFLHNQHKTVKKYLIRSIIT